MVPSKVQIAARVLRSGGLVAYPTEAIWGVGCDPNNRLAVEKLLSLKGRDAKKGLILVAASQQQLAPYLDGLEPKYLQQLQQAWPGPVTFIVPDNGAVPLWIKGGHSAVALRVSAHPLVAQLCDTFGGPIVSTSANYSGQAPAKWAWQVRKRLGYGLHYVLPGQLGKSAKPTEIRDLLTGRVLRKG